MTAIALIGTMGLGTGLLGVAPDALAQSTRMTTQTQSSMSLPRSAIGNDVYTQDGEKVGKLTNVVRGGSSPGVYAVVSTGGFMGIGDKEVLVPADQLSVSNDRVMFTTQTSADALKAMPAYTSTGYQATTDDGQDNQGMNVPGNTGTAGTGGGTTGTSGAAGTTGTSGTTGTTGSTGTTGTSGNTGTTGGTGATGSTGTPGTTGTTGTSGTTGTTGSTTGSGTSGSGTTGTTGSGSSTTGSDGSGSSGGGSSGGGSSGGGSSGGGSGGGGGGGGGG